MTFPRVFLVTFLVLFGAIAVCAIWKKPKKDAPFLVQQTEPIEINLIEPRKEPIKEVAVKKDIEVEPEIDRIDLLFQKDSPLPIVKTIQYKSHVPWKKSRAAWLVDYASHYKTHLHFIARSLNGKKDYVPKTAKEGDFFNILSPTEQFYFHLLVDISKCRMNFSYVHQNQRHLLKTYRVGLGRIDASKTSGSLTPIGIYRLGTRTAVYQPKMMGNHKGQKVELIRIFGTRWIPFEKEIGPASEPAKGYGIHGTPWDDKSGKFVDDTSSIGKYESDGCIRVAAPDMEELFSIISTHDTVIEIISGK